MNRKTSNKTLTLLILILSLIAIAVSAYLTHIHYMVTGGDQAFASFCNINASINCDAVATSAWSKLFGIPVSLWGIFFYAFLTLFCVIKLLKPKHHKISLYFFWLSVLGIIYTVFLVYVSKVILDVWCILCAVLWTINILFFILSWLNNSFTFKEQASLLWQDIRFLTGHWLRVIIGFLMLASFVAILCYTTHLETKKQELLLKEKPVFIKLFTPLSLSGPSMGAKEPRLTIVEFTDFQCPHCKTLHETLNKIVAQNNKIKVIHKDLPLDQACNPLINSPFHEHACETALFVRCAGQQNKYWPAFNKAFENQKKLKKENIFQTMAQELSLNNDEMQLCMTAEQTQTALKKDIEEASANGLNGTPMIIFGAEHQLLSGWTKGKLERAITYWLSNSR